MYEKKHPPLSGFLRLYQVLELIPISKSTWWAGVNSGKYPQSVKISKNITVWRVIDIKNLIDSINAGNALETIKKTNQHANCPPDNSNALTEDCWPKKECLDLDAPSLLFDSCRPRPQE